jgi:hypothetical protein
MLITKRASTPAINENLFLIAPNKSCLYLCSNVSINFSIWAEICFPLFANKPLVRKPSFSFSCFRKRAQRNGITIIATSMEKKTAKIIVHATSFKIIPARPVKNNTGAKAANVVVIDAIKAEPVSRTPMEAASALLNFPFLK